MTKNQQDLLDELLKVESGLSAKEMDFLEDLDKDWRDRKITDKQWDWLQAIGERVLQ